MGRPAVDDMVTGKMVIPLRETNEGITVPDMAQFADRPWYPGLVGLMTSIACQLDLPYDDNSPRTLWEWLSEGCIHCLTASSAAALGGASDTIGGMIAGMVATVQEPVEGAFVGKVEGGSINDVAAAIFSAIVMAAGPMIVGRWYLPFLEARQNDRTHKAD